LPPLQKAEDALNAKAEVPRSAAPATRTVAATDAPLAIHPPPLATAIEPDVSPRRPGFPSTDSSRSAASAPASASEAEAGAEAASGSTTTSIAASNLQPPLTGSGTTHFRFVYDGVDGHATLHWQLDEDRYRLTLTRRAGSRELPQWHSEGQLGPHGLMPSTHRVTQSGRSRESMQFMREPDSDRAMLVIGARRHELPPGTQDRLSWWLQLSAMAAANADLRTGQVLRIPVAGAQGVHDWDFVVTERQGDHWQLVRDLPRQSGRPALQWIVGLDGAHNFLLTDLAFRVDGDGQWTLHSEPTAPPPPRPRPRSATDDAEVTGEPDDIDAGHAGDASDSIDAIDATDAIGRSDGLH
jgi:Protein of unknown function (DUF3108)